ncbi:MAG: hypothetical protein WCO00_08085 [Rhodospirillaceae bacterium]
MIEGQGDRWSVRGVGKPARRLAGDLARREGMALGPWLTRLIHRAGEESVSPGPMAQRLNMVEVAVGILSQRVTSLEIDQEFGGSDYDGEKDLDGAVSPFHSQ